ncbi:MAG TPA: FAD-dependent oxidoreductase [Chroococcales cyanobacterium]
MKKHLIVGDGPAGQSALEAIRKADPEALIEVFTEEDLPFYARMKLPDFLEGKASREGLLLRKKEWYAEKKIELHLEEKVTKIDPLKKELTTDKGKYSFDSLLIATGGCAFLPPISGADLPGVFVLRTLADAQSLKERAINAKTGVIIGGGILGLEAAASLTAINPDLELTVVDTAPTLLSRQLDQAAGRLLRTILEGKRITFLLDARTLRFEGEGKVEKVVLEQEKVIERKADFVLVSAGVRSRTELAEKAGILCRRGILVNEHLQTNFPDVFAAGDAAEFEGICYGLWKPAMDQGGIAGKNMAGQNDRYEGSIVSSKLKVTGIEIASVGDFDPENRKKALVEETDGRYSKLVSNEDGLIVGGILFGDTSRLQALIKAVAEKTPLNEWQKEKLAAVSN